MRSMIEILEGGIFNLVGTQTVCSGSVLTISVVSPNNDLNNLSGYVWSPIIELDNVALNTTNNPIIINYSFSGTSSITGCTGTATLPVTVNPTPASFTISATETSGLSTNDGTICSGDAVTLLASGENPTWNTNPVQNTSSITVSPIATTTYNVTSTNSNGCQNTSSSTVTVNPLPSFTIVPNAQAICSGNLLTVSVVGGSNTGTLGDYFWSPGGETSSDLNVTPINSTTTPFITNYSLTATNLNTGCSGSSSLPITVNPYINLVSNMTTCGSFTWSINNQIYNTSGTYTHTSPNSCSINTLHLTILPPASCCTATNIINGGIKNNLTLNSSTTHAIQGNIILNGNCSFIGANIKISENVSITINPGAVLKITNGSQLYSCNKMWEGIIVLPGGNLQINGSGTFAPRPVIEDAKNAIFSNNGGVFNIQHCDLNRNLIGVYIAPFTGPHLSTIGPKVSFSTNPTLISGNNIQTGLDVPSFNPNGTNRMQYGVYIPQGSGSIKIGENVTLPSNRNVFDNMDFGIFAFNVDTKINNNTFKNIRGPLTAVCGSITNCPPSVGTAIYAQAKAYRSIDVGNSALYNNDFINCRTGVHIIDYQIVNTIFNSFDATSFNGGITNQNAIRAIEVINDMGFIPDIVININSNRIRNFSNCIRYTYSDLLQSQNTLININSNTILRTIDMQVTGIIAQSFLSSPGGLGNNVWNINNNSMNKLDSPLLPNYSLGISYGIELLNLRKVTTSVYSNYIDITRGVKRTGIRLINCRAVATSNNVINGTGILFENLEQRGIYATNTSGSTYLCNTIKNTGQSMVFEGECLNNSKSIMGNSFNNAYRGFVLQNNAIIGIQGDVPSGNTPAIYSDNKWMGTFTQHQTYVANAADVNIHSKLIVKNLNINFPLAQPIVFRPTNNGELLQLQKYSNGILNYPIGNSYTCPLIPIAPGGFSGLSGMGLISWLEKASQENLNFALFPQENKWISKKELFQLMRSTTELQSNVVLDSFYIAESTGKLMDFEKINDFLSLNLIAQADSINNSLFVENINEQILKDFNRLFLKIRKKFNLTTFELAELESIGDMCPFEIGAVVHQARALFNSLNSISKDFIDVCNPNNTRQSQSGSGLENLTSDSNIKIYPNPNDGSFIIELENDDSEEQAQVEVFDIQGKKIYSANLNKDQINYISIPQISKGIYFIKINLGQILTYSNKIEVIR